MPFEILAASAGDAALIAGLHAGCFEEPWSKPEFESLLAMPGVITLLERGEDDWRGFVMARHAAGEAEILTIGVLPEWRGRRIAERLLEAVGTLLSAVEVGEIFIEVDEHNHPAQALYRRMGFVECGRRRAYYDYADGTRSDALAMRCTLPFAARPL